MSRVLLGVSASVALYKACDLASRLTQEGHEVRTVLTARAAELLSPQLFEAVTGQPAATSEFGPSRRGAMDHIELARWAELLLVAPCTADLAARRRAFADFGHGLVQVFDRLGPPPGPPLRVFHCPMALDGKGADWLQREAQTANPYFGSSMLGCGDQTRILER